MELPKIRIVNDLDFREYLLLRAILILFGLTIILLVVGSVFKILEVGVASFVTIGIGMILNFFRPSKKELYYYHRGDNGL